jgi:TonB family protein
MRMLGRIFVIGWLAGVIPTAALAADRTTAVWSDGHTSALSDEELVRNATASPGAGYPEEAQKMNATGSGLYELQIDKAGKTTAVTIIKSSGSAALDKAATASFRKWRFKPAIFRSVRIPVTWSVNRVKK